MGEQAPPFTVFPGGLPGLAKDPPGPEFQELWFRLAGRQWASLVLVPADSSVDAGALATSLAEVGSRLRETPVKAIVADSIDYPSARALADIQPRLEHAISHRVFEVDRPQDPGSAAAEAQPSGRRELMQLPPLGRAIVAIRPIVEEPLGVIIAQAADAVLLCVELGSTDLESARRTVELVGRHRIIGALVVRPPPPAAAVSPKREPAASPRARAARLAVRAGIAAAAAAVVVLGLVLALRSETENAAGDPARSPRAIARVAPTPAPDGGGASTRPLAPRRGTEPPGRPAAGAERGASAAQDGAPRAGGERTLAATRPVDPAASAPATAKASGAKPPLQKAPDRAALEAMVRRNQPALDVCARGATADPAAAARLKDKVSVTILVAPSGAAEGSVDDPELNRSSLGACVRQVVSLMTFPPFAGEPVGTRVPLVLGNSR